MEIAGTIYFNRELSVCCRELQTMADTMIHRVPDGKGIWINDHVGLARRQLTIINLGDVASPCHESWQKQNI